MQRWLAARGEPLHRWPMPGMPGHGHVAAIPWLAMPGMLSPEQMERAAQGQVAPEFDYVVFLAGNDPASQRRAHHGEGSVRSRRARGRTPPLFDFATDADSGQRAEIRIMQSMLQKESSEEKR